MSEQAESAKSNPILSIILAGIGLMGVAAVLLTADLVPQLTQTAPTGEAKTEVPAVVEAAPVVEKAAVKKEPVFVPVEEQSQTEQVVETVKEAVTAQVEQTQETVADVATEAANTVTDNLADWVIFRALHPNAISRRDRCDTQHPQVTSPPSRHYPLGSPGSAHAAVARAATSQECWGHRQGGHTHRSIASHALARS